MKTQGGTEQVLRLANLVGALKLGKFTLSSGKQSTYYFDDRLLSLHPEGLQAIVAAFLPRIYETRAVAVGGPTVAADPIVGGLVLSSQQKHQPLVGFLVRSERKRHGTGKQVEGPLEEETEVAIVDGTLSTGGSMFSAIEAVEAQGCRVVKVLAILDRGQGGSQRLRDRGYDFTTLLEANKKGEVVVARS